MNKRLLKNKKQLKILSWGCGVLAVIVLGLFFINRQYSLGWPIATDAIGQYGDFVGGVIGTLLSVMLLYWTLQSQIRTLHLQIKALRSQITESRKNSDVFIKQQLNETFFHLLHQYNTIVDTVSVENEHLQGKAALDYYLVKMQEHYSRMVAKTGNRGRKFAVDVYAGFYAEHADFVPIYFRTLYRTFDLVHCAQVGDKEKVKYAKILRAQLTDTELVMMRYNAMTLLGKKLRNYIVEYNLLKHMPALELLEYGQWRELFPERIRGKVNVILYTTRKLVHELLKEDKLTLAHTSAKAKYNINVSRTDDKRQVTLNFNRRTNVMLPDYDDLYCFEGISVCAIEELFEAWMWEIFYLSGFGISNKSINIERNVEVLVNGNEHFVIEVSSKSGNPLRV